MKPDSRKIVIFGAGKIGRSFIGQLFSRSGYEVVFIDKDPAIINELNRLHSYKIFICDKRPETIIIKNIRGIHIDNTESLINEIASADILAISVGKNALPDIIPALAKGLIKRETLFSGSPLDCILAENMRNIDQYIYNELIRRLPANYPIAQLVGLVETSVGKMVPLADNNTESNILDISAEAYNTLIVNKEAFKNPPPEVAGLEAKTNIKAWVDRKLFIHNFGHAATAYIGHQQHPELTYLWEILEDKSVRIFVKEAMRQSSAALQRLHPGIFTEIQLQEHIDDLLNRFTNRSLGDTVFRVGCDLYRKLSPDDRIISPLKTALQVRLPFDKILKTLTAALHFKSYGPDNQMLPSDIKFHKELKTKGEKYILQNICGINHNEKELINQTKLI